MRGDVERLVVRAAERRVGRLLGEGDRAEFLAVGTEDLQAQRRGDIQVALDVDRQSVAAAGALRFALIQLAEYPAVADFSGRLDGIGVHLFLHARNDVERFLVGRQDDAVGSGQVIAEPRDFAVRGAVIEGLFALRKRHGGAESRVREVDAAGLVEHQVVGRIETSALVGVRKRRDFLGRHVDLDDPTVHLARHDVSLGVDHQAVRVAGRFQEHRQLSWGVDLVDAIGRYVAEIQVSLAVRCRPLGEFQIAMELLDLADGTEAWDRLHGIGGE